MVGRERTKAPAIFSVQSMVVPPECLPARNCFEATANSLSLLMPYKPEGLQVFTRPHCPGEFAHMLRKDVDSNFALGRGMG